MRKLNKQTFCEAPESSDCELLTNEYFGSEGINIDILLSEIEKAGSIHDFTQKSFFGWTSLPVRSLHGMTGEKASDASGEHASSDPDKFQDTIAMQPYLRYLINTVASRQGGLLKARLMKMKAGSSIGEHRDKFCGAEDKIIRYHIPIITHPKVTFFISRKGYNLKVGELYRLNVSKLHSVVNASNVDRVHLVFDVRK
jgi:hypothetical protein